jgi:hypothetical protein
MSHKFTIEEEEGIIHITFSGECAMDEVKTAVREITGDPNYKPQYDILTDLRDRVLAVNYDALDGLAHLFEERFGGSTGKSAILIDTPHETALAMLHQKKVAGTRTIELFSTRESALTWLKVDLGDHQPGVFHHGPGGVDADAQTAESEVLRR